MDFKNGVATFVMPHWRNENDITKKYLDETLEKIYAQTDKNWQLVIIDDLSPAKSTSSRKTRTTDRGTAETSGSNGHTRIIPRSFSSTMRTIFQT
jgi:hypothetical protein